MAKPTTTPPTQPGYYWSRIRGEEWRIVGVWAQSLDLAWWSHPTPDVEWLPDPITPPEVTE